jgi:hypothetical protein
MYSPPPPPLLFSSSSSSSFFFWSGMAYYQEIIYGIMLLWKSSVSFLHATLYGVSVST